MNLLDLLDECAKKGVRMWPEADQLRLRAPAGALTPELKGEIQRHKSDLVRLLVERQSQSPSRNLAIPRPRASSKLPLSLAQESLWFLHQLAPASTAAFNVRAVLRLRGALQPHLLDSALEVIVARHESLRSHFSTVEEQPVRHLIDELPFSAVIDDLSGLEGESRDAAVRKALDQEGRHVFELDKTPLFRCRLLRLDKDDWYLLLNAHHLIADAWSATRLLGELAAAYRSLDNAGTSTALPELRATYADYVDWQRQEITSDSVSDDLGFWTSSLGGVPTLRLPTERGFDTNTYEGASVPFAIGPAETEALRSLSRAEGATLFHTLLAAYAVLLHRYSAQKDFAIGTSIAGRQREEFEPLIGFFVDLLVLRQDLSDRPTFRSFLKRVRRQSMDALEHQSAPFDLILRELKPGRKGDRNPLFQALFLFTRDGAEEFRVPGLVAESVSFPSVAAKYPLSLHVSESPDELRGLVEYQTALFADDTIERFARHWRRLLSELVANPDVPVAELSIIDPDERRGLTLQTNRRRASPPPADTLHQWFVHQAETAPERPAISDRGQDSSYAELNALSNRLGHLLQRHGVGPESRVGLCMGRSLEAIVGMLAILKAGGAYVPLDPGYPAQRLRYLLADSGIELLLADEEALAILGPLSADVPIVVPKREQAALDREPNVAPISACGPSNAAYVIYTSGSTGQPKGVLVTHENVTRLFAATRDWFEFGPDDVWTLFHSFAFDFSVWEIWGALLYGGRLVVVPHQTSRNPEAFRRLLADERVTVLNQTPSAFRQLAAADKLAPERESLALRYVIFGGEALDPAILEAWAKRHGESGPRLINMYGITETTVHVTFREYSLQDVAGEARSLIGTRLPDLELYVLEESLEPAPKKVPGELFVGGAGLARGYLDRPALTAERFVPNPLATEPGSRLYRTGDRARWVGSNDVEYLGRSDQQVKVRGFRVEPGEIEEVLRQNDDIQDALIVLRDRDAVARLIAYFVPKPGSDPRPATLHDWCQARLPRHMVPAAFVTVERWPITAHGKLDRSSLPAPGDSALARRGKQAPELEVERTLAAIWSEVLGATNISIDDNFFELGGDSILSLRVLAGMRQKGLSCSVADLNRCQTIRELAEIVGRDVGPREKGLEPFAMVCQEDRAKLPSGLEDAYPLSRLQLGMLFHRELAPERPIYHDVLAFHLGLSWDPAAFEGAWQWLTDCHPALRTSFDVSRFSEPLQFVHAEARARWTLAEVDEADPHEQRLAVAAEVSKELQDGFDLSSPPLARCRLLRRSESSLELILGLHHAILDGWSVASLMTSLLGEYLARMDGRPSAVKRAPSPAEAVATERKALESEVDKSFWLERSLQLPVAALPRDPVAEPSPRRIEELAVPIPEAVSAGLQRVASEAGAHIKSVVLATHLMAIGRLTGRHDAVTGLVMNTRPETEDADRILGLFVNTLPLRIDLDQRSFLELVQTVAENERALAPHRNFPMHEVRRLRGGQDLFAAVFNFIHYHVYSELLERTGIKLLDHEVVEETDFQFLVQFSVHPDTSKLELLLISDSSQFPRAQLERIAALYTRLLEAASREPLAPPASYSLSTSSEREALLAWSGEGTRYPVEENLWSWFSSMAAARPEAIALSGDGREWTYGTLAAQATRLAHALRSRGVGPETFVGLAIDRSPSLVVAILGVLQAGGAYVPLDPAYPAERLAFMVEDSGLELLITDGSATIPEISGLDIFDLAAEADVLGHESAAPLAPIPGADHAAYVIYTSGSTGRPKGVVVTHANVVRLLRASEDCFDFGSEDVWTLFHSSAFDFSVWEIWGSLLYGGRLIVVPYELTRTPERFYALLADEGVTVLNQTPSAFRQLLAVDERERRSLSLRYVVFGGEALDFGILEPWVERHGDEAPQLVNMYGITETTVHVTYRRLRREDIARAHGSLIGRPLGDLKLHVLDRCQDLAPVGVPGELYVGGAGLARGYLGQPALTASRFLPDPFDSGRLYRTGDRARRLPNGDLEYLGRLDAQVKLRGFRIETGEIETVLRERGGLADAVVLIRPHPSGEPHLVAYTTTADGAARSPSELRDQCRAWLPDHMIPAAFVFLERWPLTPNGKLDRQALPLPDLGNEFADSRVPPRTDLEERLCRLWEAVLGVEEVGIRDGFFELGGHSLLATQLISRIREEFGVDLPLRVLFDNPTIETLVVAISDSKAESGQTDTDSIRRLDRSIRSIVVDSDGELVRADQRTAGN